MFLLLNLLYFPSRFTERELELLIRTAYAFLPFTLCLNLQPRYVRYKIIYKQCCPGV